MSCESTIPLGPKIVLAVLKNFAQRPSGQDDSWEQCSIGVGPNSVVASDSSSAVLIGLPSPTGHVATQRKEVELAIERAKRYQTTIEIDTLPRNVDKESKEPRPMPKVQEAINRQFRGMRPVAHVDPEALGAIAAVAKAAGAFTVELFQSTKEEEDEAPIGFKFRFFPAHKTLFNDWEGEIEVVGVFQATRSRSESAAEEEEETGGSESDVRVSDIVGHVKITGVRQVDPEVPGSESEVRGLEAQKEEPVLIDVDAIVERDGYRLPAISILETREGVAESGDYAAAIIDQLREFNLTGRIGRTHVGPRVTLYELEIPKAAKASKYTGLADDLRLQLAVESLRMEPVAGKAALGIEIPNAVARTVGLRELCASKAFVDGPALQVALGQDVSGRAVYADLAKMPHLLVAGATGAGKSIGLASIITSLLLRNTPKDLRMVMIDPKMVELSLFDNIPHLMCPVVTDMQDAPGVLRALVREMNRRYEAVKDAGKRNLEGFNQAASFQDRMPYIVVIIDELADLMMQAAQEVESQIVMLAQKARAVGIHLVIATQRPSVDVVTGLIKANVPSRIAFAVASQVDSRVVLDQNGAEKLLGKGDMLFAPTGPDQPRRVQGAFVSEEECAAICRFWRGQRSDSEPMQLLLNEEDGPKGEDSSPDELLGEAATWAAERGEISTSMLQRKFSIGFQRASRILELLEERGVIGPRDGPRPRKVLLTSAEVSVRFGGGR